MANPATSVLPAPVGAETMTELFPRTASIARRWKSSSGNA
jgi:hypothetical protein